MNRPHRIRTVLDLLAAVPGMLGYEPHESLVMLPFAGSHGGAVLRIDLPGPGVEPWEFALAVVDHLRRFADCDHVALAVFTDEPIGLKSPPRVDLVDAVAVLAAESGIRVGAAAVRASNGWCEYRGDEAGTLDELDAGRRPVAASLTAFAAVTPAPAAERARFARLVTAAARRGPAPLLEHASTLEPLLRPADAADSAIGEAGAALVAALDSPLHLEHFLASSAFGAETALEHARLWRRVAEHAGLRPGERPASGALITDRAHSEPVDLDRSARAIALVRRLIAVAPESARARLYAALAWLEWARGGSTLAERYARECLRRDEEHPLALEVELLSAFGVLPAWIGTLGVVGGVFENDLERLQQVEP